jgi:DNA (cytosine-5)-methyltransferase 1
MEFDGLDLFCGAGGATRGYELAGARMMGIDINQQPNYVGAGFMCRDALTLSARWIANHFDFVHASPPCQAHSDLQRQSKREYPDLIAATRRLLDRTNLPYVIENVEGAPLRNPIMLCGTMFPGLRVIRHRLFETNWEPFTLPHGPHPLVFTHDKRKRHYGQLDQDSSFVQVTGGGNARLANKLDAMGIDWMTGPEVNEAIPPAYTEFVGRQLLAQLA